jgi:hypothetical protein
MENRTGRASCRIGCMSPPSERSSKSADRLTPAQPARELVDPVCKAMARLQPTRGTPRPKGRSVPAQALTSRHRNEGR